MKDMSENSIQLMTREELRDWLIKNHNKTKGLWLITFKQASGKKRIEYSDLVDELLCFGWIDSKPNSLDQERSKLWIAPRRATSGWSKINKEKVERLIKEKRMHSSGLDKVSQAIANGTWSKLDQVENLEIPLDLEKEMKQYKSAQSNFDAFPRSVKKSILEWITSAKRQDTRLKRIAETAKLADVNIRANQWRQ